MKERCDGGKVDGCKKCEDVRGDAIFGYSCYKCDHHYDGCDLAKNCKKCGKESLPVFVLATRAS